MKKALFPGSFDPFTNGHLDIVCRASLLFDEVVVLVAENSNKDWLFSVDERVKMIASSLSAYDNCIVDSYSGLTVDYALNNGIGYIVRGLRDSQDYSYEIELEKNNRFINKDVETVYFQSRLENDFIRSSSIKTMLKYGCDCSSLLPKAVNEAVLEKYHKR